MTGWLARQGELHGPAGAAAHRRYLGREAVAYERFMGAHGHEGDERSAAVSGAASGGRFER